MSKDSEFRDYIGGLNDEGIINEEQHRIIISKYCDAQAELEIEVSNDVMQNMDPRWF